MNLTPHSRASRRGVQRLQLAPMIDVIFLLLIFFMTTTTLATPESELASGLQAQRRGGTAADLAPQILEVMRVGEQTVFRIGERTVRDREALRAVLASLPKDAGVFVKVSSAVDVADAAAALQVCRDAGYARVTYVPSQ